MESRKFSECIRAFVTQHPDAKKLIVGEATLHFVAAWEMPVADPEESDNVYLMVADKDPGSEDLLVDEHIVGDQVAYDRNGGWVIPAAGLSEPMGADYSLSRPSLNGAWCLQQPYGSEEKPAPYMPIDPREF